MPRKEIVAKHFCTDKTVPESRTTNPNEQGTGSESGPSSHDEGFTATGITNSKQSFAKQNLRSQAGDIQIGRGGSTESLFDLTTDQSNNIIKSQEEQQQRNPDFYRRRVESEWGPASKKTFRAFQDETSSVTGPSESLYSPPFVRENRKPLYEPTYYGALGGK